MPERDGLQLRVTQSPICCVSAQPNISGANSPTAVALRNDRATDNTFHSCEGAIVMVGWRGCHEPEHRGCWVGMGALYSIAPVLLAAA
jgi:hypothetical protein